MDPTTEAMTLDGGVAVATYVLLAAMNALLDRVKGRKWKRRVRMWRESIPWVAPIVVAAAHGAYAAYSGGDTLAAVLRGGFAGGFAVWIRNATLAPRKVAAAGAPDAGAEQ